MLQISRKPASLALLLAATVGLGVALAGCGGDNSGDSGGGTPTPPHRVSSDKADEEGGEGGAKGGPMASPMGTGVGRPGGFAAPGATQTASAAPAAGPPKDITPPSHRADPFKPFWPAPPPPPKPAIRNFAMADYDIHAVRSLVPEKERNQPVVRIVSNRRVAGIMTGANGISALLDNGQGGLDVVKPGDTVHAEGGRDVTVESIGTDTVTLVGREGGRKTMEVVPMSDAVPRNTRPTGMPGSGSPGGRGMFPGRNMSKE